MSTLVEQVRAALERQRDELATANRDYFYEGRAGDGDYFVGHITGADSRTEMICKLVAALEHTYTTRCIGVIPENERCHQCMVLTDLKKELGISTEGG